MIDPELRRPVTELDMVRDLEIHDGVVALTIVLTVAGCPLRDSFEQQVEQALAGVAGVTGVELSFDVMTPEERQALTQKLRGGAPEREGVIRLPRDCRVLAIASGKGGVGQVVARREPRGRASRSSVTASACSTRTSTATRSRTSSASASGRSPSTS